MRLFDWLRPPRHLLVLFAAVTLLPAAALVLLGWQFFERDRAFEQQQITSRLQTAADHVASELARGLESAARNLPQWIEKPSSAIGSDGVIARFSSAGVVATAGAPLLFVPAMPDGIAPMRAEDAARWAEAERLEHRERDFGKAAAAYRIFTEIGDSDTRALARIATARNLHALARREEALEAYRAVQRLTDASVLNEPAELVGRAAECTLLAEFGRTDELARAAQSIASGLARGQWRIDRATFEMRVAEVRHWTPLTIDTEALARASAIESFWNQYRAQSNAATSGSRSISADGQDTLLIWRAAGNDTVVFAAGAGYVTNLFQPVRKAERVDVSLENSGGGAVKIRASDTGLPWDVYVADRAATAEAAEFAARRRLLGWSLAALVLLIPSAGYMVWRAVQKELAVARLQADFVSAVSHEFRTPLTSMAHLTERLQRDPSIADDRKRQYYDVLARDTDRLRRFVETLLDFGRMEAGAAPIRAAETSLSTVVSDIVNEFRAEPAAQARDIVVRSPEEMPPVRLDREAFGRALWNLLDNASKYSPAGAPIIVGIRRESRAACVDVSDRGVGVPLAEQKQIFQKFVRGAESKSSGIKGTGVGLAMVDRIIRAHGGEVRLTSVVGEGSTFSLVLPIGRSLGS